MPAQTKMMRLNQGCDEPADSIEKTKISIPKFGPMQFQIQNLLAFGK